MRNYVPVHSVRQHFPCLLGRLPRLLALLPGILVAVVWRFIGELLLAIPFVGLFIAVVVGTWDGWLFVQGVAISIAVLPLSYLVLLLVIRQRRERRQKLTKVSSSVRNDEV